MTIPLPDLVETLLDGPLSIVTAEDPVLRAPAERYDGQLTDAQLDRLVLAMREAMHAAPGVGALADRWSQPTPATTAATLGFDLP
jgi:peptide deformylase